MLGVVLYVGKSMIIFCKVCSKSVSGKLWKVLRGKQVDR